jgi:hypothetical protein
MCLLTLEDISFNVSLQIILASHIASILLSKWSSSSMLSMVRGSMFYHVLDDDSCHRGITAWKRLSASSFKLGAWHFPTTLCTVYSGCFLKHFNIFLRCIVLQKYSKEMFFVLLNTFHMRTKNVTKKMTKHPLPGSGCKRDIIELSVGSYTEAKGTCSASQTWSV